MDRADGRIAGRRAFLGGLALAWLGGCGGGGPATVDPARVGKKPATAKRRGDFGEAAKKVNRTRAGR